MRALYFRFLSFSIAIIFLYQSAAALEADISFCIADLKYSEEKGVKICEVQHGVLSNFLEYDDLTGKKGEVGRLFHQFLETYFSQGWFYNLFFADPNTVVHFDQKRWVKLRNIQKDVKFNKVAKEVVYDPSNLYHYSTLLITRPTTVKDWQLFRQTHPSVLILDFATFPFWIDKYKMSQLFLESSLLEEIKPKWNLYLKKYSKELVAKIVDEIPGEYVVIKPRGAFSGEGVIITEKKDLDQTLKLILIEKARLKKMKDVSYSHWLKDYFDSFIVEEYAPSDPIYFEGKPYDGTMRVVFVLTSHLGKLNYHFLAAYWKLPKISLEDRGSVNDKHKSFADGDPVFEVAPQVLEKVSSQVEKAMLKLYKNIL